jgi:hypothetical protein
MIDRASTRGLPSPRLARVPLTLRCQRSRAPAPGTKSVAEGVDNFSRSVLPPRFVDGCIRHEGKTLHPPFRTISVEIKFDFKAGARARGWGAGEGTGR